MGVHGLWELLAPVGRRVSVELLGNKKLAIDASIWIVQFLKAMRDDRGEVIRNAHLLGFFRRICKLLFLRVKPVFVFDGSTPYLKMRTVIARRRQRELAQSKIRKTAEKLLLNHLKVKKLEELVREEEQTARSPEQQKESEDRPSTSSQVNLDQENADALLAASLAREWEEDDPMELDDNEQQRQQILPVINGKVDPEVLASLPPSMQLQLFDEMREQLVAENRQKYEKVAKAPSSFSKLQIEAYLKTVAFRRDIDLVQKAAANISKDGVPTVRIASEANREYIFSTEALKNLAERSRRNEEAQNTEESISEELAEGTERRDAAAVKSSVQTYLDGKGRRRVSRVRGMGVRMTRDLQWNLYLMKEKEARNREDAADDENAAEDESYAFEKLVSEDHTADAVPEQGGAELGETTGMNNMEISFVDDGKLETDEVFTGLVSDPQPDDIEWEDDDGNEGRNDAATEDVSQAERNEERASSGTGIQVSFVDNGTLQLDEPLSNLDSQQDDEEIDWEEDVPEAEKLPERVDGNADAAPVDVEASVGTEIEENRPAEETPAAETASELDQSVPRGLGTDETEQKDASNNPVVTAEENQQTANGDDIEWEEAEENGLSVKEIADNEHTNVDSHAKVAGVSEEQAQIEEAIRRSLMDFGPQKAFKSLTIQEPDQESEKRSAVPNQAESEHLRKGKAKVDETSSAAVADQAAAPIKNTDPVPVADEPRGTNFATEEEERFLDAEDRAARNARIDEERERLLQEETTLREEQKRNERNAESVTSEMFSECQELLQLFGLPYVVAPMEAEAQCAFMDAEKLVDGVVTDDSDVFLFGGRSVYKNIFDGHKYVETYYMKDAESDLGLDREKLIRMAMLLGSDYTEGISGIGIVNAIEVVNAFPEEDGLQKLREWIESPDLMLLDKVDGKSRKNAKKSKDNADAEVPTVDKRKENFMRKHRAVSKNWTVPSSFPSKAVIEAYESPQIDKSKETFEWGRPDLEMLRKFCFDKFGWTKGKADELLLPVLKEYDKRETQLRIDAFFSFNERFAKIRSSRIQKAVSGITGQTLPEMVYGNVPSARKPRKKKAGDEKPTREPRKRKAPATAKKSDAAAKRTPRKRQAKSKDAAKDSEEQVPEAEANKPAADETGEQESVQAEAGIAAAEKSPSPGSGGGFISEDAVFVPGEENFAAPNGSGTGGGGIVDDDPDDDRDFGPTEEDLAAFYEAEQMSAMQGGGGFVVDDPDPGKEEDRSGAPDEEVLREKQSFDCRDEDHSQQSLERSSVDRLGAPEEEDLREKQSEEEQRRDPSLVAIPNFRRKRKSFD